MADFKHFTGDSFHILQQFPDNSVDSVVTDAPYGLGDEPDPLAVLSDWVTKGYHDVKAKGGFMGRNWDAFVPQPLLWREVFRVLKPGGHLLSFFGTRTFDWGVMALRLAGFEVRDQIAWTYGEGMPKGLDVSKAIDRHLGETRRVQMVAKAGNLFDEAGEMVAGTTWDVGGSAVLNLRKGEKREVFSAATDPATDAARDWEGWNTGLKPAWEPIVVCRKPMVGSVAENVLEFGTGAMNADGCRIGTKDDTTAAMGSTRSIYGQDNAAGKISGGPGLGRWPANLCHDGSDDVLSTFGGVDNNPARFFYCAKATRKDRDEGLEKFAEMLSTEIERRPDVSPGILNGRAGTGRTGGIKNAHPTVKPTDLMRWLCRLVTPQGGTVLDPFAGSGSTGKAAAWEGFGFIGIELDAIMTEIGKARTLYGFQQYLAEKERQKIRPTLF